MGRGAIARKSKSRRDETHARGHHVRVHMMPTGPGEAKRQRDTERKARERRERQERQCVRVYIPKERDTARPGEPGRFWHTRKGPP